MTFDIRIFESVNSTMDIARAEAEQGASEWTVIQAREQIGGRGRRGNQWSSPIGNLYQSIILYPKQNRAEWGQLSFVIAVALKDACVSVGMTPDIINLKWPNDVLINGQKLAGILIEAHDNYVIVGTGVNIDHAPEDRAKVTDSADVSVDDFRDVFLDMMKERYDQWANEGFAVIRALWMQFAYRRGEVIQARLPNEIYEGVFEDLTTQGILLLREKSGLLREIHSGEILAPCC